MSFDQCNLSSVIRPSCCCIISIRRSNFLERTYNLECFVVCMKLFLKQYNVTGKKSWKAFGTKIKPNILKNNQASQSSHESVKGFVASPTLKKFGT